MVRNGSQSQLRQMSFGGMLGFYSKCDTKPFEREQLSRRMTELLKKKKSQSDATVGIVGRSIGGLS